MYLRNYFSNPTYNDYPVVGVTWEQANAFCAWRTDYLLKGLGPEARYVQRYRLPTEAEWEYAARGGNKGHGTLYAGSDNIDEVAWYYNNSYVVGTDSEDYGTHAVGTKHSNELGLYDMSGNVHEWCSNVYLPYDVEEQPEGGEASSRYVIRGGCWFNISKDCRTTSRDYESGGMRFYTTGLRLAL